MAQRARHITAPLDTEAMHCFICACKSTSLALCPSDYWQPGRAGPTSVTTSGQRWGLELDPPCSVLTSLRLGDMGISAWYCRVCRSTRTSGLGRRSEPRLGGWDWISPSSSHHLRQCSRIAAPSSRRRQGHWQYQVHHKFRGIRSGLQGPCGPTAKRHLHITVSHRRGRRPGPDT